MKNLIGFIPQLHLLLTFFVYSIDVDNRLWITIGNLFGHSILTSVVYVYLFFFKTKSSDYTKISVIGLCVIAFFNTFTSLILLPEVYPYYEKILAYLVFGVVFISSVNFYIQRK
jgi:ABC-type Fe3+-siderophore transport system permease subunit